MSNPNKSEKKGSHTTKTTQHKTITPNTTDDADYLLYHTSRGDGTTHRLSEEEARRVIAHSTSVFRNTPIEPSTIIIDNNVGDKSRHPRDYDSSFSSLTPVSSAMATVTSTVNPTYQSHNTPSSILMKDEERVSTFEKTGRWEPALPLLGTFGTLSKLLSGRDIPTAEQIEATRVFASALDNVPPLHAKPGSEDPSYLERPHKVWINMEPHPYTKLYLKKKDPQDYIDFNRSTLQALDTRFEPGHPVHSIYGIGPKSFFLGIGKTHETSMHCTNDPLDEAEFQKEVEKAKAILEADKPSEEKIKSAIEAAEAIKPHPKPNAHPLPESTQPPMVAVASAQDTKDMKDTKDTKDTKESQKQTTTTATTTAKTSATPTTTTPATPTPTPTTTPTPTPATKTTPAIPATIAIPAIVKTPLAPPTPAIVEISGDVEDSSTPSHPHSFHIKNPNTLLHPTIDKDTRHTASKNIGYVNLDMGKAYQGKVVTGTRMVSDSNLGIVSDPRFRHSNVIYSAAELHEMRRAELEEQKKHEENLKKAEKEEKEQKKTEKSKWNKSKTATSSFSSSSSPSPSPSPSHSPVKALGEIYDDTKPKHTPLSTVLASTSPSTSTFNSRPAPRPAPSFAPSATTVSSSHIEDIIPLKEDKLVMSQSSLTLPENSVVDEYIVVRPATKETDRSSPIDQIVDLDREPPIILYTHYNLSGPAEERDYRRLSREEVERVRQEKLALHRSRREQEKSRYIGQIQEKMYKPPVGKPDSPSIFLGRTYNTASNVPQDIDKAEKERIEQRRHEDFSEMLQEQRRRSGNGMHEGKSSHTIAPMTYDDEYFRQKYSAAERNPHRDTQSHPQPQPQSQPQSQSQSQTQPQYAFYEPTPITNQPTAVYSSGDYYVDPETRARRYVDSKITSGRDYVRSKAVDAKANILHSVDRKDLLDLGPTGLSAFVGYKPGQVLEKTVPNQPPMSMYLDYQYDPHQQQQLQHPQPPQPPQQRKGLIGRLVGAVASATDYLTGRNVESSLNEPHGGKNNDVVAYYSTADNGGSRYADYQNSSDTDTSGSCSDGYRRGYTTDSDISDNDADMFCNAE